MSTIHFLNVLEGDCNIIEHSNSNRVTVMDVCNASTDNEKELSEDRQALFDDISDNTTGNYGQKKNPEEPISYLTNQNISKIWRFIISHPDMDHIDGIKELFENKTVCNVWDTGNNKPDPDFNGFGKFNEEDWKFYKKLRGEKIEGYNYFKLLSEKSNPGNYWSDDDLKILAPSADLIKAGNKNGDYNDMSYVLLYTPKKDETTRWKILFGGDSHDETWKHIIEEYEDDVKDIDILIAPHHGRDSDRDYEFVKTLNPTVTLFGNASSKHLAYDKYSKLKITNNQAGNVIITCKDKLYFYVKNEKYRNDYWKKKGWENPPVLNKKLNAYFIFNIG